MLGELFRARAYSWPSRAKKVAYSALRRGTLKPTTPMLAPEQQPLKPATPLQPKDAPKTPISHPQRRRRFQSRLGRHPQRRQGFQTTGPAGRQGQAAVPVGGGEAWPGDQWAADVTNVVKPTQFKSPREDLCYKRRQSKPKNHHFLRKSRWIDDVCNNTRRATRQHTKPHWRGGRRRDLPRCRWAAAGPGCGTRGRWRGLAGLRDDAPSEARSADGERAGRRPRVHQAARPSKHNEAARPHTGPGGSRIRPLGGSQRLFQRICVPAAPRRWQASTTRAAMPASADLPHVRGSYCFLMPTSPSILRTPS